MTLVLGIDPGSSGAFAVYDTDTRALVGDVHDVPVWFQTVGKRKRKRVDALAIADLLDEFEVMGVELIVMEAVGGRKAQNAAHAFTFGYGVGIIYMACFYSGIVIETVPPQTWKQVLSVPGKSKADDSAIMARADELFPHDRQKFRGERGGKRIDRAEAAMIAKFGGDTILATLDPGADVEMRLAYANADTGA
jgi:hypothetical protein